MNFSYEESKASSIYHFKNKVYINRDKYKTLYNEKNKTLLVNLICKDVQDIFEILKLYDVDYRMDWKLQTYIDIVKSTIN